MVLGVEGVDRAGQPLLHDDLLLVLRCVVPVALPTQLHGQLADLTVHSSRELRGPCPGGLSAPSWEARWGHPSRPPRRQ